ncbi:hypothetical protein NCC02_26285 [Klebsiella pneumoniae]
MIGFTSYRAGESGCKKWQVPVGSTTSRNYNLQFRDSAVLYPVWDGFDLGADTDMNPEDDRPGDFPFSQYPVLMLPFNHLIDNLLVRGCLGVGFGMDGQGLYAGCYRLLKLPTIRRVSQSAVTNQIYRIKGASDYSQVQ